ncbi:MAG: DUF3662 and FHA domain-containing protein [bacterium]|nr:DUF3662 and FHA domain-containing protein [bacterium]
MRNQHIARLEAHLEQLVEGAFANLFGKRIRAQDLALQLARAMEDNLQNSRGSDTRLIAPDHYLIHAHPAVHESLLEEHLNLSHTLAQHLVELATLSGYRLLNTPDVKILADDSLAVGGLTVSATHSTRPENSTAALQKVDLPLLTEKPRNAQLVIGTRIIPITTDVVNIGRSRENHVVLDDPYVSRHHVQLRLHQGAYLLFDVHSQGGTLVNDVQVREHRLNAGDMIRIGQTQMLYLEDDPLSDSQENATQPLDTDF